MKSTCCIALACGAVALELQRFPRTEFAEGNLFKYFDSLDAKPKHRNDRKINKHVIKRFVSDMRAEGIRGDRGEDFVVLVPTGMEIIAKEQFDGPTHTNNKRLTQLLADSCVKAFKRPNYVS